MEEKQRLTGDRIDVTLEAVTFPRGSLHLIQQTIDEVVDIFVGLGYSMADGPEAELGWYNFDALNTPPTHPSRLESDTVYLDYGADEDEVLLRTQTSTEQVRWMEQHQPPVYVVVPGKVYRKETIDATHLPVFHQIEGLAIDASITLLRPQGHAGPLLPGILRRDDHSALPTSFLPVHRAQRRARCFVFRL